MENRNYSFSKEAFPMNESSKEAEFCSVFRSLDEGGQDRVLDTARALAFACAWEGKIPETRESQYAARISTEQSRAWSKA
jgi:hypothetical protein